MYFTIDEITGGGVNYNHNGQPIPKIKSKPGPEEKAVLNGNGRPVTPPSSAGGFGMRFGKRSLRTSKLGLNTF